MAATVFGVPLKSCITPNPASVWRKRRQIGFRFHMVPNYIVVINTHTQLLLTCAAKTETLKKSRAVADANEFEVNGYECKNEAEVLAKHPKPKGFGVGKVYDTSIEDKLLQEIEQSRKGLQSYLNKQKSAQANDVTTKARLAKGDKHEKNKQEKVHDILPKEAEIWIGNLPKKKNIYKDLQLVFNDYPGLLAINPIVSGNQKTRDPVCKGFAFLTFENEDMAKRFMSEYNGKRIIFGKVERKITCRFATKNDITSSKTLCISEDEESQLKLSVNINKTCKDPLDIRDNQKDKFFHRSESKALKLDGVNLYNAATVGLSLTMPSSRVDLISNASFITGEAVEGAKHSNLHETTVGTENIQKDRQNSSSEGLVSPCFGDSAMSKLGCIESGISYISSKRHDGEHRKKQARNSGNFRTQFDKLFLEIEKPADSGSKISENNGQMQNNKANRLQKNLNQRESKSQKAEGLHLGSSLRLKKKERTILTDALQKYGKGNYKS